MHEKTLLTAPDLSLRDINRIFRESVSDEGPTNVGNELPELEEHIEIRGEEIPPTRNNIAEVHPDNILPEGTRRHVRFNLPVSKKLK